MKRLVYPFLFLCLTVSAFSNLTYISLVDGITGANDPISIGNDRFWNFGITSAGAALDLDLISGLFAIKVGTKTTDPITFSLYSGLGGNVGGNPLIISESLPATAFNNQYDPEKNFQLFTPYNLTAGNYSAVLSSPTPTGGSTEYFIKQNSKIALFDAGTSNTLSSTYWTDNPGATPPPVTPPSGSIIASVPEPTSVGLWLLGGLALFGIGKRQRPKIAA